MNKITVVSLGPGSRSLLTLGALEAMERAKKLVLRTGKCDAAAYLREKGISFDTLDDLHEACEDFDELAAEAVKRLKALAAEGPVCYAVLDAGTDATVSALRAQAETELLPGVPLSAPFQAAAPQEKIEIQTADGLNVTGTQNPLLILELDSRMLAGDCKLALLEWYDPEQPTLFFPPAETAARAYREIRLCELDRQKKYDHTCAALLPAQALTERKRFDFYDLVRVLAILRGENGDPWDREQTHETLRKYLIEEAYETAEAIDEGDWAHVADELGDVLLQVAFQASIGRQYGTFELGDVTTAICRKMISRHPGIFGSGHCEAAQDAAASWEKIKKAERGFATQGQALQGVSRGLPPLIRAEKVQKKARDVGFDWDDPRDALAKVHEEAEEVSQALGEGDPRHLREEVGDLFFACVNAARLSGVDAETALQQATEKFVSRFTAMENAILQDGKRLEDLTLSEMDVYWESSKQHARP